MAGRGPQTYKKRQKEQQRKEKQLEKAAKRLQRKQDKLNGVVTDTETDDNEFGIEADSEETQDASVLQS
jgi:hypothetical protein